MPSLKEVEWFLPLINHLYIKIKSFKAFKTLNIDINGLSREEIIQLLLSDGKLIKRPFLVYEEEKVILGFNEIEYAEQFI